MFENPNKQKAVPTRRTAGTVAEVRRRVRNAREGFTLVELAVVVAVIAILASLLSTAFNSTKARSQKITCLNNVRQLALAWKLYIEDNEDLLPLNTTGPSPLPEQYFGRRLSTNSWTWGSPKEDVTYDNIMQGSLFPYAGKSTAIYHCPSDRSTVVNRPNVMRNRSYSMDGYLNGDDSPLSPDPRIKDKESELISPSPERIFVFIEEHQDSPWLGGFWVMPKDNKLAIATTTVEWTSVPSDRHNQGCNLSFADLHVEYWKWFSPKAADLGITLTANGHELRDIRRLQSAVPNP